MGPQYLRATPEAHHQSDRGLAHLEGAYGFSPTQRLESDAHQVERRQGEGQERRLGHPQERVALGQLPRTAGHEDQGQHRAIQGGRGHPAHARREAMAESTFDDDGDGEQCEHAGGKVVGRQQQHESRGRREKGAEPGQETEAQGEGDQMVGGEGEHEADEGHPRPQPAQAHAGFHQQRIDHERPGQGVEVGARALSGPPGSQGEEGEGQGIREPGRHTHCGRQGAGVRQGPDQVAAGEGQDRATGQANSLEGIASDIRGNRSQCPAGPVPPTGGLSFLPGTGTTTLVDASIRSRRDWSRCSASSTRSSRDARSPWSSLMPTPTKTPPRPCHPAETSRVRLDRARGSSRPGPRARAR